MFEEDREFILYGVGENGERFWKEYQYSIQLKFCIDRDTKKQKQGFYGYEVIAPEQISREKIGNAKIVVSVYFYEEIKQILLNKGLKEFEDFIPAGLYQKKLAIIFGNCYMYYLMQSLRRQKQFSEKYFIYDLQPVYSRKERIDEKILEHADVFMCQDIREKNKYSEYFSFSYLTGKLNEKCKVICYPNLVGFSKFLYPQLTKKEEVEYDTKQISIQNRRDGILDYCIEKKWDIKTMEEYVNLYFHDEMDLIMQKEYSIKKFIEREKKWDIKIMDYIIDNLAVEKVMIDDYHPSGKTMEEIVKRIMHNLELRYDFYKEEIRWHTSYFVYPKVLEILHFQYDNKWNQKAENVEKNRIKELETYINHYISVREGDKKIS